MCREGFTSRHSMHVKDSGSLCFCFKYPVPLIHSHDTTRKQFAKCVTSWMPSQVPELSQRQGRSFDLHASVLWAFHSSAMGKSLPEGNEGSRAGQILSWRSRMGGRAHPLKAGVLHTHTAHGCRNEPTTHPQLESHTTAHFHFLP